MAEGVIMPKAGITVESCIMGPWKKKVGDSIIHADDAVLGGKVKVISHLVKKENV